MTESDHRAKLFGTDGIRGIANMEPMTVETCVRLGRSAAHVFKDGTHRHRILIGKDTRLSGYMLENALVAGICSMGVDVLLVGPLPTPESHMLPAVCELTLESSSRHHTILTKTMASNSSLVTDSNWVMVPNTR